MPDEGYLSWSSYQPFALPPRLAGFDLSRRLRSVSARSADAGLPIAMLDGGTVVQVQPMSPLYSSSFGAQVFDLEFSAASREDVDAIARLHALCRIGAPELLLWDVLEDIYLIGSTARTAWPLSRSSAALAPEVSSGRILHADGTVTDLTLVSASPTGTEIAIDTDEATTDDLSAYVGDLLSVRYYPVRLVAASELSEAVSGSDHDYTVTLTLSEHLPSR